MKNEEIEDSGGEIRIIARNVSKWYGDVRGVSGIHLEIGSGITGLVGPNAAGKTTLINLMSGLLAPSQGELKILGETAYTGIHFRRQLGVVPQKESLYPFMTVLEFVSRMTELHGFPQKEAVQRAQEAIKKVKLAHKMHQKVDSLSKGMRQCLKLAQAIAHDPRILLLDEMFNGCDPLVKHELKSLLREMSEKGVTILLSSHNLKEMELLTDQVIILDRGKVIAQGKISELQTCLKKEKQQAQILIHGENLRPLAQTLMNYKDVTGIQIDSSQNSFVVTTLDSDTFYHRLPHLIWEGGHVVEKVLPLNQDLEALFHALVGGAH